MAMKLDFWKVAYFDNTERFLGKSVILCFTNFPMGNMKSWKLLNALFWFRFRAYDGGCTVHIVQCTMKSILFNICFINHHHPQLSLPLETKPCLKSIYSTVFPSQDGMPIKFCPNQWCNWRRQMSRAMN